MDELLEIVEPIAQLTLREGYKVVILSIGERIIEWSILDDKEDVKPIYRSPLKYEWNEERERYEPYFTYSISRVRERMLPLRDFEVIQTEWVWYLNDFIKI